jgi:acyl-CoA synthetase (AMP-forming)/AMP-acid ligase II
VIFRSPYPDVGIPDVPLTPFILRHAERLANKPALIDGPSGRTLTYGQLADGVRRVASGLARRGFRKGDVFATVCPNVPEFALALYGVASLGGATTTLNPLYTAGEMHSQLADSGARFLLTLPERLATVREAVVGTRVEEIFVFSEAAGATPFQTLLLHDGPLPPVAINPAEDVVMLPYSSGTTGRSKGVMLTHSNLVAALLTRLPLIPAPEGDTVVGVSPFFHIAGLSHLSSALHAGATLVLQPRFDLQTFLQVLQDSRATRVSIPPPVVLELSRNPIVDEYDLSRLGLILWGSAPVGDAVTRACRERLGCRVKQIYGLTEGSGGTHAVPIADEDRPGSAGVPLAGTEYKITGVGTGVALPPGQRGEICLRGPLVMKGYLNRPEETAQVIDAEGWLHTGDLGVADADGWLSVVDRLKELIKYKAFQVAPAELEAILLSHPAVADAAVIPSPDEEAGEVPKAFVVLKNEATPEELMAHVAEHVAPYKKIRGLEFIDQIPKSAAGKILRRVLVERERASIAEPVLV